jgi:hypothetical protein
MINGKFHALQAPAIAFISGGGREGGERVEGKNKS